MKCLNQVSLYTFICVLILALFSCTSPAPENIMQVTTSSDEALEFYLAGVDCWDNWESEEAARLFDSAIALDPDFAMAYLYRSFSGGGYDVYRQNLDKALSLMNDVSDGEQVFLTIVKAQSEGDGETMNRMADSLLSMFPDDERVPYLIGSLNLNGNIEENNQLFKTSIQIDSTFSAPYSLLTDNYTFLKDFEQAEKFAKMYIILLPEKADPYQKMGTLYRQQGKLEKAIEMYEKMLDVDPDSSPFVFIGNCYTFLGDYEKAREFYLKSYEIDRMIDWKLSSLYNYSISYVFEGDIDGALKAMEKYREEAEQAEITTSVIGSYFNQAAICIAFEKYDLSEEYLHKAIALIESSDLDTNVRSNYDRNLNMWKGFLLIEKGDVEAGKKYIDIYKAMAEERNMPGEIQNANFHYGNIALLKGDYAKAVDLLKKSGDDYLNWYRLGEAYEGLGDKEKAKELYEKIATSYLLSLNLAFVRDKAMKKLEEI